jgi:altronate dehydratase large subunit
MGCTPNLAAVILGRLGGAGPYGAGGAEAIAATGKPVEILPIQETGGLSKTLAKGTLLAQKLVMEASRIDRQPCDDSDLVIGLKCGSSDTTSGLAPNPALGLVVERLTAIGGTAVMGEVTEFIGAEHLLAAQAKDEATGRRILDLVARMENRAKAVGVDMRGGQPTPGNIKGGLTTIEEKSLGAIAKAGHAIVQDVYEYGERPKVKGLVVMDSPGREPELLTGMAAAGCNVIVFTTGRGAPQGFPFVPVLKVTGNRNTWETLVDHMDMSVHEVIDGSETMPAAADRLVPDDSGWSRAASSPRRRCPAISRRWTFTVTGPVI